MCSQQLNSSDTLLIKQYWNKIYPVSKTSVSGVLYSGIDNYLELSFPDEDSKNYAYHLTTNNGKMFAAENGYLTIPDRAGRSFINIYLITYNSDTLLVGKKQLLVKNVPYPAIKIGNTVVKDSITLDRGIFFANDSMQLFFTDDLPESGKWYRIVNFSIGYVFGSVYISVDADGAKFDQKVRELIRKVNPGKDVLIRVNSVTPTRVLHYLPVVKFKII
jgi:hypothetical protein